MSAESPAFWAIRIRTDNPNIDLILPEWLDFNIESFWEEPGALIAYVPESQWTTELDETFGILMSGKGLPWEKEYVPARNWNAVWETEFDPVRIPEWCLVRAEFHEKESGYLHEILIRPQMAFGTGHHETTYMMLEWLKDLDVTGKNVFDYGCGTGILAILAAKLGANKVLGVDIEEPAIENAQEHAVMNQTPEIQWALGDLEACPKASYDLVLANINRNVLLDSASALYGIMNYGGDLLLSGILKEDKDTIFGKYQKEGFQIQAFRQRGNWLSIHASKPA